MPVNIFGLFEVVGWWNYHETYSQGGSIQCRYVTLSSSYADGVGP